MYKKNWKRIQATFTYSNGTKETKIFTISNQIGSMFDACFKHASKSKIPCEWNWNYLPWDHV